MTESATGIVLRTRPLTETSLIVNWLTAGQGRISTVAKGARRPKSPFVGMLDLFYEADFSFSRSRRSELHPLRELSLQETNAPVRQDMGWLQQACYAAALIELATERETPLPAIHALLLGFVHHLPAHPPQARTVYAFELKLLGELGLAPEMDESNVSSSTRKLAMALSTCHWNELPKLTATAAQAMELQRFLHGFLLFHLGRIPKGR